MGRARLSAVALAVGAVVAFALPAGAEDTGVSPLRALAGPRPDGLAVSPPRALAGPRPDGLGVSSLPTVPSGHRPGPDILHAPPPEAPQLENVGVWEAEPILVSGARAYRDGEFLYQDFLYDDYGAAGIVDPLEAARSFSTSFAEQRTVGRSASFASAPPAGTLTYPRDPVYANNAADLVELRVKRLGRVTAFRVTLNTLIDPERTAFTIALGTSPEPRPWPHGAGVRSPARLFLTVHGEDAELREAVTGTERSPEPDVRVDLERRQFDVRVPPAAWDPGDGTVRMAAGVGLWDRDAGGYLRPGITATETSPGGAAPGGAALFNVAFRFDEPKTGDGAAWRERAQAEGLADGDVSDLFAEVDFAGLAAGVDDDSAVPRVGRINRIFPSHNVFGQGVDWGNGCGLGSPPPCVGPFVGQLQPYALYVPDGPTPADGWGFTFLFHSWTLNHNQYLGTRYLTQLADRGPGSLVATPLGRGPDGIADVAEADAFEVWADVARHYPLDPEWVSASGYSMGGGSVFLMLTRWPDLFARGAMGGATPEPHNVLSPAATPSALPSLRNVPVLTWIGALDEGNSLERQEESVRRLEEAGLRFVYDQFLADDHFTLPANDEWGPLADFLGEHRVDRDPSRVSYVVDSRWDSERAGVVADHAYWLSDLRLREGRVAGTIDARSEAFGAGEPEPLGVTSSLEVLEGGAYGPRPYRHRRQGWGPAPAIPEADRLVVRATGIASATVDVERARLSCDPDLRVTSDGPLRIVLDGCGKAIPFPGSEGAAIARSGE